MVEEGLVLKPTQKQIKNRIHTGSLYDLFLLLTVMVDLDKTADVIETACFHFTDVDLHFVLKVSLNLKSNKDNYFFSRNSHPISDQI